MAATGGTGGEGSKSTTSSINSSRSSSGGTGKEGVTVQQKGEEEHKEDKFRFSGQVIAAIVVAAVAGNVVGARHYRKTILSQVARNAQRKKEAERAARAAKDRAAQGSSNTSFGGNPLYGRTPEGWDFDDSRDAAFAEQRLNSQVVQNLSTLGVKNFVAGREEVKTAYRKEAMRLHPDRSTDSLLVGGSKRGNEQEFKRVAEAYAWLDLNYFRQGRRPY